MNMFKNMLQILKFASLVTSACYYLYHHHSFIHLNKTERPGGTWVLLDTGNLMNQEEDSCSVAKRTLLQQRGHRKVKITRKKGHSAIEAKSQLPSGACLFSLSSHPLYSFPSSLLFLFFLWDRFSLQPRLASYHEEASWASTVLKLQVQATIST